MHAVDFPAGAIIIPAYNEAAVIARALTSLAPVAATGRVEMLVVCNGCSDNTADLARQFDGVRVIETRQASKVAALNLGDRLATLWPRLYLDADVEIAADAIAALFQRLAEGDVPSARPVFEYDASGAGALVRSYYRARTHLGSVHNSLWGAGAYGVTREGHERFREFPDITLDDFFIDRQFARHEKEIVNGVTPVRVHTPKDVRGLLAILQRTHRGNQQQVPGTGTRNQTMHDLAKSIRGPVTAWDAAVYAAFALTARYLRKRKPASTGWERDESSRIVTD